MTMIPDFWRFDIHGAPSRARTRPRQDRAAALVTRADRDRWAAEDEGAPRSRLPRCAGHPPKVDRQDVPYALVRAATVAAEVASAGQGLPLIPVNWYRAPAAGAGSTWLGFFCGCNPLVVYVRADHPGDVAETVAHEIRHVAQHREHGPAADDASRERRENEALAFGAWQARQIRDLGPERALRRARGDCR